MKRSLAILAAAGFLVASAGAATYRVRPGDTLSGIAAAHHLTLARLLGLNDLDPAATLQLGTRLRLPERRLHLVRYLVRRGDTLSGIAVHAGTTVPTIAKLNQLDPGGLLLAGTILRLPGTAEARTTRDRIRASIRGWAAHYRVDAALALALAWQESGDQPGVVSAAGAKGVMQVMPDTWRYMEGLVGQTVPETINGNIRIGVAYLHHLLHVFAGNRQLALAAYLQGETSVREQGILPSSRGYIANILALATGS